MLEARVLKIPTVNLVSKPGAFRTGSVAQSLNAVVSAFE